MNVRVLLEKLKSIQSLAMVIIEIDNKQKDDINILDRQRNPISQIELVEK